LIKDFKNRYKHLEVYIEPGEAIGYKSGVLISTVLDIVDNGMKIAILDTSAEAHMSDTIIMPYIADVRHTNKTYKHKYILAGNTCLAGDIMGEYNFNEPLKIGDKIIFEDMIHYTIVKNTTFNGIKLPSLSVFTKDCELLVKKEFGYSEYKRRN
jgi:carboxynorspermidine decarboxylase